MAEQPETWADRVAGRLEYELEDFRRRGLDFQLDDHERAAGRIVLRGQVPFGPQSAQWTVVYPDNYPYFRPEIYVAGADLPRHQNPYEGNLCLLDRSTRAWNMSDTAAWLAAEQGAHLFGLVEAGGEALAAGEVPQGEPITAYFPWEPQTVVFVPEPFLSLPDDAVFGSASLLLAPEARGPALRALLRRVRAKDERGVAAVLASEETGALLKRFNGLELEARWVRLQKAPAENSAQALFEAAAQVDPDAERPPWQNLPGVSLAILGVVIPTELQQGLWSDNWLFAIRFRVERGVKSAAREYVTHGERLSADELADRVPSLRSLKQKRIALCGLGALGAPLAFEFARAQIGGLTMLDFDRVELGTTVRWPLGLSVVGHQKTAAVAGVIGREYVFTDVRTLEHRIGDASPAGHRDRSENQVLGEMLADTDLLVDATAELGVQHLLSDLGRERGLPQVYVSATEGAWGGVVARVIPNKTGCWFCLQLHFADGTITLPPHSPEGTTQPRGCATRTFTGSAFDLLPLVAQAARMSVHLLTETDVIDGPDVALCALETDAGPCTAPRWSAVSLERHSDCPYCSA